MTEPRIPLTDDELAHLAALAAPGDGGGLDDELIAALVQGSLPAAQQEAAERRLLASDEIRALLIEASDALPTAQTPRARPLLGFAIAASLLLVVGGAIYAAVLRTSPAPGTEAGLESAALDLRTRAPDLFAGFAPLDTAERAAGVVAVERSALRLLRPAGRALARRPVFAWTSLPGAASYHIRLFDDEGGVLEEGTVEATRWVPGSPLARGGDYVLEVGARGPLGPVVARRAVRIASTVEATVFGERRRAVGKHVALELQDLVLAHVALRAGLLVEAETAAASFAAASPEDAVGRETLAHVQRLLGVDEE